MKHKIAILFSFLLFLAAHVLAQQPSMSFDGAKLEINVPTGYLEFNASDITSAPIREAFAWDPENHCLFMAQPDPYIIDVNGLSTDETLSVNGFFQGEPITIPVVMRPAENRPETTQSATTESKGLDTKMLLIIAGILVALMVGAVFLLKARKKRKKPKAIEKNDPNIIAAITDESVKYDIGLDHVKKHPNEYLLFDMDNVFNDTAVKNVHFSTALIKKLYDFFNNSLEQDGRTNETGCFIVGCWDHTEGHPDRYDISLEYMVEPGDDADFGEYSLNFGKKISINMASVIDNLEKKSNRDYALTCWMHSHPGLGLFLSNQDLIVQQQLTYPDHKNRLIAIVIDTNTPDFKVGFFTAKANGKMNNKEDVKHWFSFEEIYRQSREQNRTQTVREDLQSEFVAKPDYFTINLNGASVLHIGFAPHSINQIDNALYSNNKGLIGYFYGELQNNYLEVGCFLPYENEEKLGALVFGDNLTEAQLMPFAKDIAGCHFILNATSEDRLKVMAKDENGGYATVGETTLTEMKEWIRRKRV